MKEDKPWYKKWWVYVAPIIILVIIIAIPFIINEAYKKGEGYITMWGAGEVLSFYGTLLAFLGTVSLGVLALWQNQKFKNQNDISQQKLEAINTKLLDLDIEKQKQNLLELYFVYMEENQKLYDPEYVLQKVQQLHDTEEIFFRLKKAEMSATAIKRRLMFLDSDGVKHSYFDYCSNKSREIISIVMQKEKDTPEAEVIKEIFQFWKDNAEKFNEMSLLFIFDTNKRLKQEEK